MRPPNASILASVTLDDGTEVYAARCEMRSGQITGSGWLAVRIGDGEWHPVEFSTQLRLRVTLQACSTREELEAFVVNGMQHHPFYVPVRKGIEGEDQ